MKRSLAAATAAALASLALSVLPTAPASAQRCVSGAELRGQVSAFVHGLRAELKSPEKRQAVKGALVESVRAARGAKADTPEESRGLGSEIRLLGRQLVDATDKLARDALIAEIHALQDQKKAARTTSDDVQTLRSDLRTLAHDLARKAETDAQGRQVSAFVHDLMAQFNC
jgi:hypothetical protein